jgi:hypothetical protein
MFISKAELKSLDGRIIRLAGLCNKLDNRLRQIEGELDFKDFDAKVANAVCGLSRDLIYESLKTIRSGTRGVNVGIAERHEYE